MRRGRGQPLSGEERAHRLKLVKEGLAENKTLIEIARELDMKVESLSAWLVRNEIRTGASGKVPVKSKALLPRRVRETNRQNYLRNINEQDQQKLKHFMAMLIYCADQFPNKKPDVLAFINEYRNISWKGENHA